MKFNIGDRVEVVNTGNLYSSYGGWINIYAKGYRNYWVCGSYPDEKEIYTIVAKGKHEISNKMIYLIQNNKNKRVYIIGEKGIKLVEKKVTLKDLKLGDILTVRDGKKFIKIKTNKAIDILDGSSWIGLNFYKNDLIEKCNNKEFDIMKVERAGVVIFERKKEILDEQEKKYLRGVIRPFRDRVKSIRKIKGFSNDKEYIDIGLNGIDKMCLPDFKKGTMYKGMELEKKYTLEELGL